MALRKREKTLTLDEIKEKLIQGTREQWIHGEPLCGVTPLINGGSLIPLSAKSENSIQVIFLLDVADYTTERVLEVITRWQDRYRKLPWMPIVVFKSKYLFLKNLRFYEGFRQFHIFPTLPVFVNEQNDWFQFYNAEFPTLIFSQNGETLFKTELRETFLEQIEAAENALQTALRKADLGLPLLEVAPSTGKVMVDHARISHKNLKPSGYWTPVDSFSIASDDTNARINISFSGTHLRLTAVSHPQARENTKAFVFLDEQPLPASLHGKHVHTGDRGQSVIEFNKHTGIYELVKTDRMMNGVLSIRFVNAHENPIVIYEARTA